jgi:hypothetical protein
LALRPAKAWRTAEIRKIYGRRRATPLRGMGSAFVFFAAHADRTDHTPPDSFVT